LRGGEAFFQAPAEVVTDARRGGGEGIRQLQNQFLVGVEEVAFLVRVQVTNLIVADAYGSASGRVDIDSKGAFHQLGGANLAQPFQFG
jgi:hypothetical protein